jgi:transcriptional regulator with XRE-family HTH domain
VEAAQAAGVSQKQVSQIEMGKVSRPHPDTLRSLATAFGVDVKRMMSACRESYRRAHPETVEAGQGQADVGGVSHTPSDSNAGDA